MISVIIVNFNQAQALEKCIVSLGDWAQEVIVIDLGSTDDTEQVANKYHVKLIRHPRVDFVEQIRQKATSIATHEWVLVLDPDEQVGEKLKSTLSKVADEDKYVAVNIPRKNIFFGKWVRHTNFWPDRQVRFFQKNSVIWPEIIHAYPRVDGKVLELEAKEDLAIEHYGYHSFHEFFDRQNRYSSAAVGKFSMFNLFWLPVREVLVRYIKHAGFLDGFLGLSITYALAIYQVMVQVKLWEKTKN